MNNQALCQVRVEQGELYLLSSLWEEGNAGMDLALTDCDNAWAGSVSEEQLGDRAKAMKMDFDDYVTETKKAVTRQNLGSLNFEYSLKKQGTSYCFSWKKFMAKDKIRIQLGQCIMRQKEEVSEVMKKILEHSINSAVTAQENIQTLNTDNQRLSDERAGAIKRLDKAVAAKDNMEHDLYSKFVEVINNKKKKIRELKEELENPEASVSAGPSRASTSHTQKRGRQTVVESGGSGQGSDGNGSDYQTDDEDKIKPKRQSSPPKKAKPAGDAMDDSVDLSLDIEEDTMPTARQRRGRRQVVKKTPSKAVIPKVPSSEQKKTPGDMSGEEELSDGSGGDESELSTYVHTIVDALYKEEIKVSDSIPDEDSDAESNETVGDLSDKDENKDDQPEEGNSSGMHPECSVVERGNKEMAKQQFQCDICNVTLASKYSLQRHSRQHNDELFTCSVSGCDRSFTENCRLNAHISSAHQGIRLVCAFCEKQYCTKLGFQRHMSQHTGDYKFRCSICNKGFSYQHAFKEHVDGHHGVKPHQCSKCTASFTRLKDYKFHTEICDKPSFFKCNFCSKAFKHEKYLERHLLIHSSPNELQCATCGKTYSHKTSLMKHQRSKLHE